MLTDSACRTTLPGTKERKLSDGQGLYLAISPAGNRVWRFKYRWGGKERKLVIGGYPLISLKEARAARDAARVLIAQGSDPAAQKQAAKRRAQSASSFETVARAWHASKARILTPRYAGEVLDRLAANAFPILGSMPVDDITPPDVLAVTRRIEARQAYVMAHVVRQHMSEVFVWAIASGLATNDPAAIIRKALIPAPPGRYPAMETIEDARRVLIATEGLGGTFWSTKLVSRLLALTASRPSPVREAERAEFEGMDTPEPIWRVPAAKLKQLHARKLATSNDFLIPLSRQAAATVAAAMKASRHRTLLFPNESNTGPLSDSTISKLYRDAGFTGIHVPHGWRASFATVMNRYIAEHDRLADRDIVDMMLGHKKAGVEPIYNRYAYLTLRRELGQIWADMLCPLQDHELRDPGLITIGPRRKATNAG